MTRDCDACGTTYEAKRRTSKYCTERCRKRAQRRPVTTTKRTSTRSESQPAPRKSEFEKATERELRRLGQLSTMLGQQALAIARRMGNGAETGSAIATLSREHSRLMGALTSSGGGGDPVDEVRQRREQKKAAARSPAG